MERRVFELNRFRSWLQQFDLQEYIVETPVSDSYLIQPKKFVATADKNITLGISGLVHGNELVGIQVINQFLEMIVSGELKLQSSVFVCLGNVEAYLACKRFIEKDMNRNFLPSTLESLEEKRAKELEPWLSKIKYHLDFHQTIKPSTSAMMIFSYNPEFYQMLRFIAPELPFILFSNNRPPYRPTALTGAVSYFNGNGVTIELGEQGFNIEQALLGIRILRKTLNYLEGTSQVTHSKIGKDYQFSDFYILPTEGSMLIEGLVNLSDIESGQKIGIHQGQDIIAPFSGKILFPKYGQYVSSKEPLFRMLSEVHESDFDHLKISEE